MGELKKMKNDENIVFPFLLAFVKVFLFLHCSL